MKMEKEKREKEWKFDLKGLPQQEVKFADLGLAGGLRGEEGRHEQQGRERESQGKAHWFLRVGTGE